MTLSVFDRDEIEEKYAGKLMKEMSGLEYEIVSRVMKTLVNRKITVPGSFIRSVLHRLENVCWRLVNVTSRSTMIK